MLLSLSSCEDIECVNDHEPENEDILLSAGNYITFHADVNTRAGLQIANYITDSLGIYGYQYDFAHEWSGQRAIAVPNVFWNENQSGEKVPLKVIYNSSNGLYNYYADNTPGGPPTDAEGERIGQVNWSNNRYAFWAYYPYVDDYDDNDYIQIKHMDSEGMPFIEYTVDRGSASDGNIDRYGDTDNMYDIMTGGKSQVTAASSGNTVTFTMSHRLSAVDVSISNAYQHNDGNNVTEDVDIYITDLKLTFENLKYDKAKFYLEQDKNIPALNTVLTPARNTTPTPEMMKAYYNIIDKADIVVDELDPIGPTTDKKTNITADANATMTFIPQETTDLKVTAKIEYYMIGIGSGQRIPRMRVNEDGEPVLIGGQKIYDGLDSETYVPDGGVMGNEFIEVTKTTDFEQALVEGTRYYIVLSFTSEAVSINIITAEAWDDKVVEYEFM